MLTHGISGDIWDTGEFVKIFCLESIYKILVASMHVPKFFLEHDGMAYGKFRDREMFHSFSPPSERQQRKSLANCAHKAVVQALGASRMAAAL